MRSRSWNAVWLALWIVLAAFGAAGFGERFISGHRLASYTSYVPWGMWVAAYIYFIGLSAGAFLLSSLIYVFGVDKLERVGKLSLYVAVVTLLMALVTIWFDLGHPTRFWEVYTRPQFHSMMAWMVWLYTAYFLLLVAELCYALRSERVAEIPAEAERDRRTLRILGSIGVPLAVAFHGGVGALFGTVVAREYWHSPIYPILFLTGALVSGGALVTFLVAFLWPERDAGWRELVGLLGRIVLGLALFDLLLEWAEYSIPMWYGVGSEYRLLVYTLFGPYWYVYWIVHILLGVAVPVFLLARAASPRSIGIAAGLVAFTFFAVRLDIVIPGLITPELQGLQTAYMSHRLSYGYMPSLFEWQVLAGIVALGLALLYLGYRYLPLARASRPSVGVSR